jgi:LPXTG-site transpeptidase (sortase) family protein
MLHKFISLLFLGVGIFLLVQVLMPFISYKAWEAFIYPQQNLALVSPKFSNQAILGISIENKDNFSVINSNNKRLIPASYTNFLLSIPSINLQNAEVIVDSNNFEEHLAHLPGSALPGEKGNIFVSGHSSLPQFFKQGNYKAIFSKLPDIKKGDQINIEAGGQKYVYVVKGIKIVDPQETWVINPPDQNGRYLSLMTCVPPGLYLKRLIVLAELK